MQQNAFYDHLEHKLLNLKKQALYKSEAVLQSPQATHIHIQGKHMLNFCANNYLGLANHPKLIEAAKQSLQIEGVGLASVRFICGTQKGHKKLEHTLSNFLNTQDCILYSSCFDANTGLFETILNKDINY